jgi:MFS family permease
MATTIRTFSSLQVRTAAEHIQAARLKRWPFAFNFYSVATNTADSLLLVFASALGAGVGLVALIEALGDMLSAIAPFGIGRIADRVHSPRKYLVVVFAAAATMLVAFSMTSSPNVLVVLCLGWGVIFVSAGPMVPIVLTRLFRRSEWATQQARLSSMNSLGTALGFGLCVLWLFAVGSLIGEANSIRMLFIAGAIMCGLAAVFALLWLRPADQQRHEHPPLAEPARSAAPAPLRAGAGQRTAAIPTKSKPGYSDGLKNLFFTTMVLFFGIGIMAGIYPAYMMQELGAEVYKVVIGSTVFNLAAGLAMPHVAHNMGKMMPARLHALGSFGRSIAFLSIGLVGLMLTGTPAHLAVIGLMAFSGLTWAATATSGGNRLVYLAPARQKGAASGHFTAFSFMALAAGAVIGGQVAGAFGYFPAFLIASICAFIASVLAIRL